MAKIKILDDKTINQIAAGEVIENPASVIKELIENAYDAGAKNIRVETKSGGRTYIQVSDDGQGMDQEDLMLCIQRHTTSKIDRVHDLLQLHTLGFRGEALASIASVSKMHLHSSTGEGGHALSISGGIVESCEKQPRRQGTTMTVRQLFYNVPVRRAFQKSIASDTAEISKTLSKFALGVPDVGLTWVHDNEVRFELLSSYDLLTRIKHVLGEEYAADLITLEDIGYIGQPSAHRPNRIGQYLAINHRPISSAWLSHLILQAYGTRLPPRRFPSFVLQLTFPTQWVDVNVHPQKHEVRLREQDKIAAQITDAVEKALQPSRFSISFPEVTWSPVEQFLERAPNFSEAKEISYTTLPVPTRVSSVQPVMALSPSARQVNTEVELPLISQQVRAVPVGVMSHYLILEIEDAMQVLDLRRALHRLRFEAMQARTSFEMQALLIPQTVEVLEEEKDFLIENLQELQQCGIGLRHFGGRSFLVEALPDWIALDEIVSVLQEITQNGMQHCLSILSRSSRQKSYHMEEAKAIFAQLQTCGCPDTTPDGKRVFIEISMKELHAKFQKA